MKYKILILTLLSVLTTVFTSCQDSVEPNFVTEIRNEENSEFSITVKIPDEIRTRSTSAGEIGEDGLYNFQIRDINKLWYAVYYDDSYRLSNTVVSTDSGLGTFNVNFTLSGVIDLSKLNIFFWAGNEEDETAINGTRPLIFDFNSGSVHINNAIFNGLDNVAIYDSFSAYINFSDYSIADRKNITVTLKRPFAQIHILSDDFIISDLKDDFKNGVYVFPGIGDNIPTNGSKNSSIDNIYQPRQWYYRAKTLYVDGSYPSSSSKDYEFHNTLSGQYPERVTFKGRQMDYLSCFYIFIPDNENLKIGTGSTTLSEKPTKINFAISSKTNINSNSGNNYISIDLPPEGIKPNTKYIIYNKSRDDGGSGFLTDKYNFQLTVIEDGNWDTPNAEFNN